MDISKYEVLTGLTVAEDEITLINANIRRTKAKLETLLGFTLFSKNIYNELGKAPQECACPDVDISTLLPADGVNGIYKLFPYNKHDKNIHVDPFTNMYKVKLVYVTTNHDFVTVKEFNGKDFNEYARPKYMQNGIGKFIEKCETCFCTSSCYCEECLQIAIDADWLTCYPDDLMYLWVDMITYESDCDKNLVSESVDGHSWSKAKDSVIAPQASLEGINILKKYAGPNGSISKMPV